LKDERSLETVIEEVNELLEAKKEKVGQVIENVKVTNADLYFAMASLALDFVMLQHIVVKINETAHNLRALGQRDEEILVLLKALLQEVQSFDAHFEADVAVVTAMWGG
jgi:hypothetical protein